MDRELIEKLNEGFARLHEGLSHFQGALGALDHAAEEVLGLKHVALEYPPDGYSTFEKPDQGVDPLGHEKSHDHSSSSSLGGPVCPHGYSTFERTGRKFHIGTGGVCLDPEAGEHNSMFKCCDREPKDTESDPPAGWVRATDGSWSEPEVFTQLRKAYIGLRTPPWSRHAEKMARLYSAIEAVVGLRPDLEPPADID